MIDSILTIETGLADLVHTPEFYQTSPFEEKKEELLTVIFQKKNFKPFASMKIIRSISFFIKRSISLWQLQGLASKIETMFGPSCFQISIDRQTNTAHMLCSWIDKETGDCIVLNRTEQKKLSVLVLDYLDLPRPRYADMWLRYFLLNKYDNNPSVFGKQIELLERSEYENLSFPVLRDSLKYVEMVCKGLLK
uniref:Uncharacterized protein n=1 Tax=Prevotella sp. GTC17254 TaxID=3236794 RepID=A0AB33IWQ2_9BACT